MAFYGDYGKQKSRGQKRKDAEMRGGFEDEGSQYGGASPRGNAPRGNVNTPRGNTNAPRSTVGKSPYGGNKTYGQGNALEGRGTGNAPRDGKKAYGQPRSYSDASRKSYPNRGKATDEYSASRGKTPGNDYTPRGNVPGEYNAPRGKTSSEYNAPRGTTYGNKIPGGKAPGGKSHRGRAPFAKGKPGYRNEAGGPRDFEQKGFTNRTKEKSNSPSPGGANAFRFTKSTNQPYSERGAGTKPRSYGEQREVRQREDFSPRQTGAPRQSFAPSTTQRQQNPSREDFSPRQSSAPQASYTMAEYPDAVPAENLLSGRNPIREALKSGRDIEKLLVARGELSGSAREIVQMAKERRIPVQEVDRTRLDAITLHHQGMLAFASAHAYRTVQDMLDLAAERGEPTFLVVLDSITDPHNLGAIIRSAECVGAHGVIVQERRAVGLTPAAVKASAGAVEYLPVARVTNLTTTLLELKAKGIWIYAADRSGEDYAQADFSGPVALVIGAEGEGISRRVLDTCDKRVSLPIRGQIDSLNASVAAGVLLYAIMRMR